MGVKYPEVVKIGNFLFAKGFGWGVRLNPIGNCLVVIPMQKGDKIEDFIKDHDRFNTIEQSVLFSYHGKLHTPCSILGKVGGEILFVSKPSCQFFYPNNDFKSLAFRTSEVDCYDASFVEELIIAFKCRLGLNNIKTRQLKAKIELTDRELRLSSYSIKKAFNDISSLKDRLEYRVEAFGEDEFTPTVALLSAELIRLKKQTLKK